MKNFVDNDVWTYDINIKRELASTSKTIYTKPFPQLPSSVFAGKTPLECKEIFHKETNRQDNLIMEKYFTKERIQEYKDYFCKLIQETENPFDIVLVDIDGGYNVTEDQLLKLE